MTRRILVLAVLVLIAACGPKAVDSPDARMATELGSAYQPYSECVSNALRGRQDFDGQLAEMVVAKQLDGQLNRLALRYLGLPEDADGLTEVGRVEAARSRLLAFGKFGGAAATVPPGPADVRRIMAVVESMTLIAAATDVSCEVPENLIGLMEKAQNEYF